jgi:DNA-binding NarL/FixJ family response regulator
MDLVRTVYKGGYSMNSRLMTEMEFKLWLSEQLTHYSKVYSDPGNPLHPLSDRELEVLNMIVDGKSNKEIGNALSLSEQTIKNHVTSIFRKFGVEDRTQAVIYAMKMGWVKII